MNLKEATLQTLFMLSGIGAMMLDNQWLQLPCLIVFAALAFHRGRQYEKAGQDNR